MHSKTFFNSLTNSKIDILQTILDLLADTDADYCVIGGLAVNAYAEPVVSLDIDLVITTDKIEKICEVAEVKGFSIQKFEHSVNLKSVKSDLRIQIQTDPRYQDCIARAVEKEIFGYKMKVASLDDVLQGKIWAYMDETRRKSKRQKDLADILRLIEVAPELMEYIPANIRKELKE
jgi:hypothetical protein